MSSKKPVGPENPGPSPGKRLREERERAGMSLKHVAEETRIPISRLDALEQDDYQKLGSAAYVTGYTRAYARVVGVAPESYVKAFEDALGVVKEPAPPEGVVRAAPGQGPLPVLWIAAGVALILMIAALLVLSSGEESNPSSDAADTQAQQHSDAGPVAEAPVRQARPSVEDDLSAGGASGERTTDSVATADTNAAALTRSPEGGDMAMPGNEPASNVDTSGVENARQEVVLEPVATAADELVVAFSDACWISVTDSSGQQIVEQLAGSGDNLSVSGQAPFKVVFGDVRAVQTMALNGEAIEVAARPGSRRLTVTVGG